jgi:hypothetical protein
VDNKDKEEGQGRFDNNALHRRQVDGELGRAIHYYIAIK